MSYPGKIGLSEPFEPPEKYIKFQTTINIKVL